MFTKYKKLGFHGYNTYTMMYHDGVTPILDYCSEIWGFKSIYKIDSVQNRAIHLFLGVHSFAPNQAIKGDLGWINSHSR